MNNETLIKNLRNVPDFPIPGIQFKDVSTLFKNAECLKIMTDELYEMYKDKGITKVVGIESRGFVVGAALAYKLGAGFVMCRKPGKLPADTRRETYMKEYGKFLFHYFYKVPYLQIIHQALVVILNLFFLILYHYIHNHQT